jgi:SAM-dependent methyltransferase
MNSNILTKGKIYRDSKTWYAEADTNLFSKNLIIFCQQYAGRKILDFGCATGNYCLELRKLNFECVGVDINEEYIKIARQRNVTAYVVKDTLPFEDKSFDTVIMFELLEHVQNPEQVLKESKRVALKNILITVPNCGEFEALKNYGMTYDHFLDLDHINFFTKQDMERLLSIHFKRFRVEEREPITLGKIGLPWWLRKPISLLSKLKFIKTDIHYRIYAVIDLEID